MTRLDRICLMAAILQTHSARSWIVDVQELISDAIAIEDEAIRQTAAPIVEDPKP